MPDFEVFLDLVQIPGPAPYITMPAVNKHKHRQLDTSLIPDHSRNAQGAALKSGTKTPGVQRQYLGCVGKIDNGIVTVHLGVAKAATRP